MPFTAQLGTANSYLSNIELGFGAISTPFNLFSGIYTLVPGKTNDTVYSNINLPQFTTAVIPIFNPFIRTAPIGD